MNSLHRIGLLLVAAWLLPSCANYHLNVKKDHRGWKTQALPAKKLDYKVFLIGDAGTAEKGKRTAALQLLKQELEKAPENSAVVFLGDNAGYDGLPKKKKINRQDAEQCLKDQLDVVKPFKGKVFFVAGHEDWAADGVDGVRRQEEFIEEYLGRDVFFPNNGCGDPEAQELTKKLGILLLNSEWYLTDWDKEPEINEECEVRTRLMFTEALTGEMQDFREKNLLVVAHHPLYSQGHAGGHYSLKENFFPFSLFNPPKYIPLPIVGTAGVAISEAVVTRQEIAHPIYQEYISTVKAAAKIHGNVVYAAGHEHNMQLEVDKYVTHIISGAGSQKSPAKLGKNTPMTYGGRGFSVLHYYDDGEAWVEFLAAQEEMNEVDIAEHNPDNTGDMVSDKDANMHEAPEKIETVDKKNTKQRLTPRIIYRQKIIEPLPTKKELTPDEFPEYEKHLDTVAASVYDKDDIWDLNNFVWGKLWTDLYFMDLKMPVLDLQKYKGGLTAIKEGGGFQTKSVRLATKNERRVYQIRGIQKSADNLFYPLNKTFARNVLEHQYTAGNPFSAFVLTPMQEAIGIYHSDPKLVYVPKQPGLNRYNDMGGEVFLFEERPDEDWSDFAGYGFSKKIVSTGKALEERMESDKAVIDQPLVLRNRLFDMLIGDWDRHDDQWRWATFPIEGTERTLYQPIPRDRDQAMAKYEGIAFHAARIAFPYFRATHPFDDEINKREARWVNFQAKDFDAFFLNENEWPEWEKQVRHIQTTLTDEAVEKGVHWLPDTVFAEMGDFLIKSVKSRRDHLMESARNYYVFLNKTVSIVATQKENHILVERLGDGHTRVTIFEYKDEKTRKDKIYERLFENNVTKELRIYGLEGDDDFEITGKTKKSPIVRFIGGIDEDKLVDESEVRGMSKRTKFYDDPIQGNKLEGDVETEDKRNRVNEENSFIFNHIKYNAATYYPILGFNPDDGISIGAGMNYFSYGYRNEKIHRLSGEFQSATAGFVLDYVGEYTNIWGRKDIYIEADVENPQYVTNFFGLGNETERLTNDRSFYRVRRHRFSVFPALRNVSQGGFGYAIGPMAEMIKIDRIENTFIVGDASGVRPEVFEYQYFGGVKGRIDYKNVQRPFNPQRGVVFEAEASWQANLEQQDRNFFRLGSSFTAYLPLDIRTRFLYAFKVGGMHNIGEFDFFQANTIGGDQSLRGYADERFAGRTVFYHNNEIRWNLISRDFTHLPFTIGIAPAFDYARVWVDDETSSKWHYGYGGSLYLAPLDYAAVSLNYMQSVEGSRFVFTLGFTF